jgi:hypothetical protein
VHSSRGEHSPNVDHNWSGAGDPRPRITADTQLPLPVQGDGAVSYVESDLLVESEWPPTSDWNLEDQTRGQHRRDALSPTQLDVEAKRIVVGHGAEPAADR